MKSINQFQLSGNLTKDPELKSTKGGTSVCRLTIAVNDTIKTEDGYEDKPMFPQFTVFGKTAETMSKYLQKGSKIFIQGKLGMSDKWEDKEGITHYPELQLKVFDFMFMDSKPKSENRGDDEDSAPRRNNKRDVGYKPTKEEKEDDEWLPFDDE